MIEATTTLTRAVVLPVDTLSYVFFKSHEIEGVSEGCYYKKRRSLWLLRVWAI